LQTNKESYQFLQLEGLKLAYAVRLAEKNLDPILGQFFNKQVGLFALKIRVLEVDFFGNQLAQGCRFFFGNLVLVLESFLQLLNHHFYLY